MPFARPTLQELVDNARAEVDARLPGGDSRLRRSLLDILIRIYAGGVWGVYGFAVWVSRQVFPDTAEAEFLQRWATIWGLARTPATFASGTAEATGTDGSTIPVGARLQRADGVEFQATAEAMIASGTATVSIQAVEAGDAANTAAATKLTFTSPVPGVAPSATVDAPGLEAGQDPESDAKLRERLLAHIREPPHGGALHDYEAWALEALTAATRVWVSSENPGEVLVLFVKDEDPVSIIPTIGEIQAVQSYIDAPTRRPVTADVTVAAPAEDPIDFTISITPDTAEVRAAVAAELAALLQREGEPAGTIFLSRIREAVSRAAGETDNSVTVPAADHVSPAGEIPTVGAITWV